MIPCLAFCLTPQPKHPSSAPTAYSGLQADPPPHASEPDRPPLPLPLFPSLQCFARVGIVTEPCAPRGLSPGLIQAGEMASPTHHQPLHVLSNGSIYQEPGPP